MDQSNGGYYTLHRWKQEPSQAVLNDGRTMKPSRTCLLLKEGVLQKLTKVVSSLGKIDEILLEETVTTCLGNCCSPGCRLWCLW